MLNTKQYYKRTLGPDEIIPISYDKIFKLIFGDIHHLERLNLLLSTILEKEVKVVDLLNNDLLEDNRVNKANAVDLVCELDGEYVSVEVNLSFGEKVIKRNLSFVFRMVSKELKPGDNYENISRYYQVNINQVDHNGQHYETIQLRSDKDNKIYSDIITIININVSYYAEMCYNSTVSERKLSNQDKIFGIIGTDKKSVIEKITLHNKILEEIGNMAQFFSSDDEIIFEYDWNKLMMDDYKEVVRKELTEEITKEVTQEVTDTVKESNSKEIAKKMKEENMDIDIISRITGLSQLEIEKL